MLADAIMTSLSKVISKARALVERISRYPSTTLKTIISIAVTIVALSTTLVITTYATRGNYSQLASRASEGEGADLEVLYMSRDPKIPRYVVKYDYVGYVSHTGGDWYQDGQPVTYTVHIRNNGPLVVQAFKYRWTYGDQTFEGNYIGHVDGPGPFNVRETITLSKTFDWEAGTSKQVSFEILPYDSSESNGSSSVYSNDPVLSNNKLSIKTDSLSFVIYVERSVYDQISSLENASGTKSFEGWLNNYFAKMNEMLARTPDEPNYDKDKVTSVYLDTIKLAGDGTLPRLGTHTPGENPEWDSRWGFENTEWSQAKIQRHIKNIDWGLLHEWGHQVGMIDVYRLIYDANDASRNYVNGGTYYSPGHFEYLSGLMVGDSHQYSDYILMAMATNYGQRRGLYGEYLYDIPSQNTILAVDEEGNPICGAVIKLYQVEDGPGGRQIDTTPEITGKTLCGEDAGLFRLPNRQVTRTINVPTGHTLRPNPFGDIDVVGMNGIFLVEIEKDGKKYYDWLGIYRFNMAYWRGQTDRAMYKLTFSSQGQDSGPGAQKKEANDYYFYTGTRNGVTYANGLSETGNDRVYDVAVFNSGKVDGGVSVKLALSSNVITSVSDFNAMFHSTDKKWRTTSGIGTAGPNSVVSNLMGIDASPLEFPSDSGQIYVCLKIDNNDLDLSNNVSCTLINASSQTEPEPEPESTSASINLSPAADTYIDAWHPNSNYAKNQVVKVRATGSKETRSALMNFDFAGIENLGNVSINNATLKLHVLGSTNPNPIVIVPKLVKGTWAEKTATWNNRPIAGGRGVPVNVTSTGLVSMDVTDLLNTALKEGVLGNGLLLTGSSKGNVEYNIASSEYWKVSFRPVLHLDYEYSGSSGTSETPVTIEVDLMADSFIDRWNPSARYGNEQYLKVRANVGTDIWASLMTLDPSVGSFRSVTKAILKFTVIGNSNDQGLVVYAHPLHHAWSEDSVTWSNYNAFLSFDTSAYPESKVVLQGPQKKEYEIDITDILNDLIKNGESSYGISLTGVSKGSVGYTVAGRSYWNEKLRPKVVVTGYRR